MLAQHIIHGNGHSSTQITEEFNHPWEGVSFAHLLPPKFCMQSKEREYVAKQKPSHFQPFFFSSLPCPSPRKLVHIDLKIRHSSINSQSCMSPQRENRPNPFSQMKKLKSIQKNILPDPIAVEIGLELKFSNIYSRLYKIVLLFRTFYKPIKRTVGAIWDFY